MGEKLLERTEAGETGYARAQEAAPDGEEGGGRAHHIGLGMRGEEAAAQFLSRQGYEIVERNWTCAAGEVDIIAQDEEALVFVEVKTRSNCDKGLPEEAVDAKKRTRYERIAAAYLCKSTVCDQAVRFDVISILTLSAKRAFLRHHIDAFSCGE